MSAAKLTPWFEGNVKPARVGIYEVRTSLTNEDCTAFSHFDGAYWNGGWHELETAVSHATFCERTGSQGSCELLLEWRGLASDPAKATGSAQ